MLLDFAPQYEPATAPYVAGPGGLLLDLTPQIGVAGGPAPPADHGDIYVTGGSGQAWQPSRPGDYHGPHAPRETWAVRGLPRLPEPDEPPDAESEPLSDTLIVLLLLI